MIEREKKNPFYFGTMLYLYKSLTLISNEVEIAEVGFVIAACCYAYYTVLQDFYFDYEVF